MAPTINDEDDRHLNQGEIITIKDVDFEVTSVTFSETTNGDRFNFCYAIRPVADLEKEREEIAAEKLDAPE